ncbi:L,D-transpeptidase family protein [Microbacterium sp. CFBP9034]|uniref:L,D-transpeptidase family protein n=1 Tax=Microbacterium sp. CFBP9034 TaxID=3096540 RepID=UPI002A6A1CB8|nr:L,D-transpeptidase family protein [Microbacterium sp. CFBP9034]MDY0909686.1 L,D-transpeptidase family protein [Microbacterium sp. CFBP9034]
MRSPFTAGSALLATGVLVVALVGCGTPEAVPAPRATTPTPTPVVVVTPAPTATVAAPTSSVAEASVPVVTAYDAPDGAAAFEFGNPIDSGAPLTFYVEEKQGEWLHVRLPTRPNGSTGWIRSSDVHVKALSYSLLVSTAGHTVTLLKDDEVVDTFPAAVGTGDTPTPLGEFYLTELLAPTNDGYGPFAYGISAFSEVLNEFGGGPGQIGMHGTDDAASIGQSASHGCIRLSNEDITMLAGMLPLGTPITIE